MEKKWKILIILILFLAVWVRFAPAAVWYQSANERLDWYIEKNYYGCNEENATIVFEWSWWSLRFTDVYPDCLEDN